MKGIRGNACYKGLCFALAALALLAALTGCSSNAKDSDDAAAPVANQAAVAEERLLSLADQTSRAEPSSAPAEGAGDAALSEEQNASLSGGGIGPIADANAGYGRQVIYRADLVMKVEEFKAAEEQLLNLIHLGGAYVLQFSDSRNTNEIGASYVIKVPSEGFSSFLEKLQKIKSLKFEREVKGSDVTEEFVDLDARLKTKKTLEARLMAFMDKAVKTADLVTYSNELAQVQGEIEQIEGRIRYLKQNVAFSTVSLRLYQPSGLEEVKEEPEKKSSFGERMSKALSGSLSALGRVGEGLLVAIAAILPVLLVAAIVGVPAYFGLRKRSRARRERSAHNRSAWNSSRESTESDSSADLPTEESEESPRRETPPQTTDS
jgi:hypothetical protein